MTAKPTNITEQGRYTTIDNAIKEIMAFCSSNEWVEYDPVINFVQSYLDILPKTEHSTFVEELVKMLDFHFKWKMPYPSDSIRIENEMKRQVRLYGKMKMTVKDGVKVFESVLKVNKLPRLSSAKNSATEEPTVEIKNEMTDREVFITNTIDEYLEPFKGTALSEKDYMAAVATLFSFFQNKPINTRNPYFVKHGNKKKLGYALCRIYRSISTNTLSYEYLSLCKQLFECYKTEILEEGNFMRSNLYKYFSTKTQ